MSWCETFLRFNRYMSRGSSMWWKFSPWIIRFFGECLFIVHVCFFACEVFFVLVDCWHMWSVWFDQCLCWYFILLCAVCEAWNMGGGGGGGEHLLYILNSKVFFFSCLFAFMEYSGFQQTGFVFSWSQLIFVQGVIAGLIWHLVGGGGCVRVCVCVCVGGGVMAKYMPLCVHTVVIFCPCARLVNVAYWSYILARNFKLYRQASVWIVNLSIALQWIPERQRAEIINFTSQKFVWKETWKPSPWLSCLELLTPPSAHRVHGPPVFNYIWTPLAFQAHYSLLHSSRKRKKRKEESRDTQITQTRQNFNMKELVLEGFYCAKV